MDHRSTTCHLRLTSQRLELATQFGREILQASEVALHSVEFAQGLFFALAMLENSGSLFDEASSLFGCCREHLIELALTDDDVHLAADT